MVLQNVRDYIDMTAKKFTRSDCGHVPSHTEPIPNSYDASIMFSAVIAPEASQLLELFVWLLYVVSFTT